MKAILLSGGTGSRMKPTTSAINKHLLPVYNKPMIFYSLSVLLLLKFKEIIIICDPGSINLYKKFITLYEKYLFQFIPFPELVIFIYGISKQVDDINQLADFSLLKSEIIFAALMILLLLLL